MNVSPTHLLISTFRMSIEVEAGPSITHRDWNTRRPVLTIPGQLSSLKLLSQLMIWRKTGMSRLLVLIM